MEQNMRALQAVLDNLERHSLEYNEDLMRAKDDLVKARAEKEKLQARVDFMWDRIDF